jgi:hypothetical protein
MRMMRVCVSAPCTTTPLTHCMYVLFQPWTVESQIVHFELASPITSVDLHHGLELFDVGMCVLSI